MASSLTNTALTELVHTVREVKGDVGRLGEGIALRLHESGQAFGELTPQHEVFEQIQPKLSLSFEPVPDLNIYGNWGIGFKSGGFNNQGSSAIVDTNFNQFIDAGVTITDQYDKEWSSAFEAGVKGSLFNDRITYDLAGYYTQIHDMQFFEFFVGSFGLLRVVSNIDKVNVKGAEINLTGKLTDWWNVFGSFNVTDSEIRENSSRPYTVGNKSPYTADYTINLGTDLSVPINDAVRLIGRVDYRITGPTWFHSVQDQERPTLFDNHTNTIITTSRTGELTSEYRLLIHSHVMENSWSVSGCIIG